jgi:hypothetical protein
LNNPSCLRSIAMPPRFNAHLVNVELLVKVRAAPRSGTRLGPRSTPSNSALSQTGRWVPAGEVPSVLAKKLALAISGIVDVCMCSRRQRGGGVHMDPVGLRETAAPAAMRAPSLMSVNVVGAATAMML